MLKDLKIKMILNSSQTKEIIDLLNDNKVGVMPTDTVYGIHCKALNKGLIDRVYEIKMRPKEMPFITLISSVSDLRLFDIELSDFEFEQTNIFWPGPNTLILQSKSSEVALSFRIPNNPFLQSVLSETGPLISTSANLYKEPTSTTIQEAEEYFGDKIDFYVDGGRLTNPPSNIYKISGEEIIKIR